MRGFKWIWFHVTCVSFYIWMIFFIRTGTPVRAAGKSGEGKYLADADVQSIVGVGLISARCALPPLPCCSHCSLLTLSEPYSILAKLVQLVACCSFQSYSAVQTKSVCQVAITISISFITTQMWCGVAPVSCKRLQHSLPHPTLCGDSGVSCLTASNARGHSVLSLL